MPALYQNRAEHLTAKISKNNAYPAHIHRQVEIFYVLEGELSVTIREQTRILKKGDLSVTFPNLIHQTKTPVSSKALMLIFDVREFPDFQTDFTTKLPASPFLSDVTQYKKVFSALSALTEYATGQLQNPRLLKGYLAVFLSYLFDTIPLVPNHSERPDLCQSIAEYLDAHFLEPVSLTALSHDLGYSKYHVSHVCNEKFGCSLSDYVNRLRAEHAMGLLTHTDLSITDICYASGFRSLRTFYRVFREYYQKTPGDFIS